MHAVSMRTHAKYISSANMTIFSDLPCFIGVPYPQKKMDRPWPKDDDDFLVCPHYFLLLFYVSTPLASHEKKGMSELRE